MDVPSPLLRGDQRKESVFLKVNELCQYLRAERLNADGRTIALNRTGSGVMISALRQAAAGVQSSSGAVLDGFFKVSLVKSAEGVTMLSVLDGYDKTAPLAGYAYYNGKKVECPTAEGIAVAAGYLCLGISKDAETYTVGYTIEASIPDMPTLESITDDNTAKYPIAEILGSAADGWSCRQLQLSGLPALWCFGPCDTETTT